MIASVVTTARTGLMSLAVLGGFAFLATEAHAQSANTGLYIGLGAGLNQPTDSHAQVQEPGTGSIPTVFGFGTGYNVLGDVGYKWNSNIRTELELDYRHSDVSGINSSAANGSQGILGFSGNVLYDFNIGGPLTPYLGGGLGIAHTHWSNVNNGFNSANFSDSDANLQWQLIGGVSMRLTGNTSLFVDYRYIGVADSRFYGSAGEVVNDHYDHSNNVIAGLRFFL